jgi:hypothetical protein
LSGLRFRSTLALEFYGVNVVLIIANGGAPLAVDTARQVLSQKEALLF